MSHSTSLLNPDEITLQQVACLAEIQSLAVGEHDLANVHRQFKLIASHASLVMGFGLDEEIEPAGEFRP